MITIVDFDIGNISAVANMLANIGCKSKITSSAGEISEAQKIILPGNGSFDSCMRNLRSSGLEEVLHDRVVKDGIPLLGICVGAQILGLGSEEGTESGLGWIDMEVVRFPESNLPIPHMGWNQVDLAKKHPLGEGIERDARFYFVHSFYLKPKKFDDIFLSSEYGISFAAGVAYRNIVGVQFHPEKSHRFGKSFLKAFASTSLNV